MKGQGGSRARASATVALFALVVTAVLALAACGGASTTGESPAAAAKAEGQTDSSLEAWPKADAAVKMVAGDAVLLSAGNSGGLALAGVPESWSFTFFSPSKNHVNSVSVEHGTAQAARDLGETKANTEVGPVTAIDSIKVGAADPS